jgi:hypothetical protein
MSFWSSDQTRLSGASMEGDWNGVTLRGIQKITISDEVQREPQYGNSSVSIGMPAGTHKASLELETIPEEADNVAQALGDNLSQVPGTVGIYSSEPNGGTDDIELSRVFIDSINWTGEAGGQKGQTKTIKCTVLDPVDWNGLKLITDQREDALALSVGGFSISL